VSPSENGGDTPVGEDGGLLTNDDGGETAVATEFDFSTVKPESFVCFGTIDPGHDECNKCPFKEQCAEKAGVSL